MDGPSHISANWFLIIWLSTTGLSPLPAISGPGGASGRGCGCLALESGLADEILLESGGGDCIQQECAPVDTSDCLLLETGSPNEILLESGGDDCIEEETGEIPGTDCLLLESGGTDELLLEAGGNDCVEQETGATPPPDPEVPGGGAAFGSGAYGAMAYG